MNPKISVIMPLYNAGEYVRKTIDSILAQTYPDFELLLIDDCSTDNTMDVVRAVADPRIRIIHNERNKGIAFSRNAGLDNARGEYIALMDDDDLTPPDRFEKEVAYLEAHPEIGVVGGSIVLMDKDDRVISGKAKMIQDPDTLWCDILFQCPMANSSTMLRGRLIRENRIRYRDNMYGMEDYQFWMEISNVTRIYNFDEAFLKWRVSDSSETTRVMAGKALQRKECFAEIQKNALLSRGFCFTEGELALFTQVFSEYKDAVCSDLKSLYRLMVKLQEQTCKRYPDKASAMTLTARNRFLEAAAKTGVHFMEALDERGFGGFTHVEEPPLVSVVIPTHDRADLIARSVQSVLRQTYQNIEVIVVDDGSTDHTGNVLEELCEKHAKVSHYRLERSRGPAGARNFGAGMAKGKYIAFHDDDDEWHPDKLEIQMDAMFSDPSIDMSFGQMARYQGDELLGIVDKDLDWEKMKEDFFHHLLLDNYVGAPTVLIKKEAFEKAGGFCEEIHSIEDWEFAIRAAMQMKVGFVPTPLMDVHVRRQSVTHNSGNYAKAWIYIYRTYSPYAEDKSAYTYQMLNHVYGNCIARTAEAEQKELIEEIKDALVPDFISDSLPIDVALGRYMEVGKKERYIRVCKALLNTEKMLAARLHREGYKKVAVYGIGLLGKALIERLESSGVTVERLIDRKGGTYQGKPILTPEAFGMDPGETQLLIITPLYEAEAIGEKLTAASGVPWRSIEDL